MHRKEGLLGVSHWLLFVPRSVYHSFDVLDTGRRQLLLELGHDSVSSGDVAAPYEAMYDRLGRPQEFGSDRDTEE